MATNANESSDGQVGKAKRAAPKYRSSCDNCQAAKIRCGQEKPSCRRCSNQRLSCVYSLSRRTGRPRHLRKPIQSAVDSSTTEASAALQSQVYSRESWSMTDLLNEGTSTAEENARREQMAEGTSATPVRAAPTEDSDAPCQHEHRDVAMTEAQLEAHLVNSLANVSGGALISQAGTTAGSGIALGLYCDTSAADSPGRRRSPISLTAFESGNDEVDFENQNTIGSEVPFSDALWQLDFGTAAAPTQELPSTDWCPPANDEPERNFSERPWQWEASEIFPYSPPSASSSAEASAFELVDSIVPTPWMNCSSQPDRGKRYSEVPPLGNRTVHHQKTPNCKCASLFAMKIAFLRDSSETTGAQVRIEQVIHWHDELKEGLQRLVACNSCKNDFSVNFLAFLALQTLGQHIHHAIRASFDEATPSTLALRIGDFSVGRETRSRFLQHFWASKCQHMLRFVAERRKSLGMQGSALGKPCSADAKVAFIILGEVAHSLSAIVVWMSVWSRRRPPRDVETTVPGDESLGTTR